MEKQEIFNIHGYPIVVNLKIGKTLAHRFTFNGGQINMSVTPSYNKKRLESLIEKALPESKVKKYERNPVFLLKYPSFDFAPKYSTKKSFAFSKSQT